ncbi:MAG: alginate lyase family protein [Nannocystaceae bacterium]
MKSTFRSDGVALQVHAIQWAATGEEEYAQKAIEIMSAWANAESPTSAPGMTAQHIGFLGDSWVAAAEILKHYRGGCSGWSQADAQQFDLFIEDVRVALLSGNGSGHTNPFGSQNQPNLIIKSRLAFGIYLEDDSLFQDAQWFSIERLFESDPHRAARRLRDTLGPRSRGTRGPASALLHTRRITVRRM